MLIYILFMVFIYVKKFSFPFLQQKMESNLSYKKLL